MGTFGIRRPRARGFRPFAAPVGESGRWSLRRPALAFPLLLAAILLLPASPCRALSESDILLHAPLDDSADARTARGNPKALVHGKLEFAEGRFGKGYYSGRKGDELLYESRGNVDADAGTVALWVKPLGWSEKDPWMRFWFRAGEAEGAGGTGSGTFLWLYKYLAMSPLYWLVQQTYFQKSVTVVGGQGVYRPGEWTHLAATWCGPVMRLYANGRYLGLARTPSPRVLRNYGAHLYVGGESWTPKGDTVSQPDSVLDDLYVLRRPVTLAEVRALMEKGRGGFEPGAAPGPAALEAESAYFPSEDQLHVRLMVNGRRPGETQGLTTTFAIESVDSARLARPDLTTRPVRDVNATETLGLQDLPAGRYRVLASLLDGGRVAGLVSADFEKPRLPEWLGTRVGIPVSVPEPWTPIVQREKSLECWGRRVELGDSLFPTQLVSQGQPLLARPISLVAMQAGRTLAAGDVRLTWKKVTELRADYVVEAKLGTLPVRVEGWMEYDGFVWTEVSLPAAPGVRLDALRLEIPLRADVAALQHGAVGGEAGPRNGKVAAWNYALEGQPFLWLGNEEVGLQWSTGDNYCWENRVRKNELRLQPGKEECLFTATLVDHPIPLDRPLTYTFGLEATPVRPLPRGWRAYDLGMNANWRPAVGREPGKVPVWAYWYQGWNLQNEATRKERWLPGYPAVGPWTRETVQGTAAAGSRAFLYSVPSWAWRAAPEYAAFHSEWNPESPPALPFESTGASTTGIWRTVPSFQDWLVWRWWRTFQDNPWLPEAAGGIYNDVVQGFWGPDPRPDREGMMRCRHELLGAREIQKRMYVAFQKHWPNLVISNHQSGDSILSQLAFAHVYATGENYAGNATLGKEESYVHVMDLDSCRAELLSGHWGIPILFLPEIPPSGASAQRVYGPEGIAPAEHLAGLLLAHDVIPWNTNAHPLPFVRLAALKESFGWDEQTRFVGYWKSADLVKCTADAAPVVVSVYQRPGKAMLVVMNNSDQDASVTLAPDWGKLGVPEPREMQDAYLATGIPVAPVDMKALGDGKLRFLEAAASVTPRAYPVEGRQVRLSVPRRNFRVLVVGNA